MTNVLWLRPTTGENISVGRERIAEHLRGRSISVDVMDVTGTDALSAVQAALFDEYDVVVGTTRAGLYVGYPLARLLRMGFVADVADPIVQIRDLPDPLFRVFEWYEKQILKRTTQIAVVYDETGDRLRTHGIGYTRVENGVDFERFADPDPDAVRESERILTATGVSLDAPIAVYIGGISTAYYLHDVLVASERCSEWQFVFIGEGPLEETIRDVAAKRDNVFFPGAFEYRLMPGFLFHADAGLSLVPIDQSLKILEYGAAGLPTIGMRGGLSDRFSDDEVLLIDPSPKTIADALERLRTTEGLSESYGEALRDRARGSRWSDIADTYETLINECQS